MSEPVKLYVYDLSNGIAKQMSLQLTGRQINGIWHTSIVVFGKEVFYGQGIDITAPGQSHHGNPLHIIDLGTTALDEETFNEYLEEMREHYTADKYHLLDFNCNSFTNDCAAFLTGGSIPDFIKGKTPSRGTISTDCDSQLPNSDLPSDFLSTPFGAALRPTIDAMYRRPGAMPPPLPTPATATSSAAPNPELTASILQAVAAQAQQGMPPTTAPAAPLQATDSLVAPFHSVTNSASLKTLLRTHKAVVVNFSDMITCPPCRVIAPVYEQIAHEKGVKTSGGAGAAFAKIDLSTSSGKALGAEWSVRVMPTFIFFLDGQKISEMKGADANELRNQIDLLLFQAYPPHPHTSLSLPAMQTLSLNPILFTQVPALDTAANKLVSFVDSAQWPAVATQTQAEVKQALSTTILPYLKSRSNTPPSSASPMLLSIWAKTTFTLAQALPLESLFPLVDMWRLAILDSSVATWFTASLQSSPNTSPLVIFLTKVTSVTNAPRAYLLTLLRLLSNAFSSPVLAPQLLLGQIRALMTAVLIPALLHEDASVRTASASLVFNAAAFLQKGRVDAVKNGGGSGKRDIEDEDWEIEISSAVVEAIDREKANEDVVHRLAACLGCLLRLSPFYESQMSSLLEVLQVKSILRAKLAKGGCGDNGVSKKDVKKLVEEIADKLCP
ncbi:PPPDE putative peptidase domain-containing protein [Lentinula guzmanii]|uniref:PPPDE putative peptidase domain-containing protein n=1 Tax=Lentinula guzmanii TaxID=2804957 RepID=A0AA38JMV2_9AGAR|nr:PPPDE putative peptidase domain-containing protein [Lentinula guzmanii]